MLSLAAAVATDATQATTLTSSNGEVVVSGNVSKP